VFPSGPSAGDDARLPQVVVDRSGDRSGEFIGEVRAVDLDDLVVDDRVADGKERADEAIEVGRPDVVVPVVELPVEEFERIRSRARDVAALLEARSESAR
jgi:hypothetical protein